MNEIKVLYTNRSAEALHPLPPCYGPILDTSPDGTLRVMQCDGCGFAHLFPLPEEKLTLDYYKSNAFYSSHSPRDWFDLERAELPYFRLVYADWLDTLATYTDNPMDESLSILDVGAGSGWFLDTALTKGWVTTGIEPAPQARLLAEAKGLRILSSLEEAPRDTYDAAAMILTLEHITWPLKALQAVRARLIDSAPLLVMVPNDGNPLQTVARQVHNLPAWWIVSPHIAYFSVESLGALMTKAGFEIVETRCTYPIEEFLLSRPVPYVGNEELGRAMYREKMAYETALYTHGQTELLRQTQKDYAARGIGREIVMVWRKQ